MELIHEPAIHVPPEADSANEDPDAASQVSDVHDFHQQFHVPARVE